MPLLLHDHITQNLLLNHAIVVPLPVSGAYVGYEEHAGMLVAQPLGHFVGEKVLNDGDFVGLFNSEGGRVNTEEMEFWEHVGEERNVSPRSRACVNHHPAACAIEG